MPSEANAIVSLVLFIFLTCISSNAISPAIIIEIIAIAMLIVHT